MKKNNFIFPSILVFLLLLIVYKWWFSPSLIAAGDLGYLSPIALKSLDPMLYVWDPRQGFGLGGILAPFLWIYIMSTVTVFYLEKLNGPHWLIIERLVYLYPFLIIGMVSIYQLTKKLNFSKTFFFFSSVIYLVNTYILMVLGGGQVLIGLAYSLAPSGICGFMHVIEEKRILLSQRLFSSILIGLLLALQVLFDVRIAYITFVGIVLYFLLYQVNIWRSRDRNFIKHFFSSLFFVFILPTIIAILLHMFWLLPTKMVGSNPVQDLGSAYSTTNAVKYFSFAKFENSISLLHPNWPENIFGKVNFMRPGFLFFPILAFSSLLFVSSKKHGDRQQKLHIIYFSLLALLGSFLAKGANDPLGSIYLWLFDHMPGFILFRDPSKWYVLIAVSYSVLIPFTAENVHLRLRERINNTRYTFYLVHLFSVAILFYIIWILFPAFSGQLTGAFQPTNVPRDYQHLEEYLSQQHTFFRTLWIPTTQRFGYASSLNPAISARDYFNAFDNKKLLAIINNKQMLNHLQEIGVKYIIIPYDSEKEIFLSDRKYDSTVRTSLDKQIAGISELKRVSGFGMIDVFSLPNPKDQFWSTSNLNITYQQVNPTKYTVELANARKGEKLIFSESYDSNWVAKSSTTTTQSTVYEGSLNSFTLPKNGNYTLEISFTPQKWVTVGLYISLGTLVILFALEAYLIIRDKRSLQK